MNKTLLLGAALVTLTAVQAQAFELQQCHYKS